MRVLAINCGSSTLKFRLLELEASGAGDERRLTGGIVKRIGGAPVLELEQSGAEADESPIEAADHAEATAGVLAWLDRRGLLAAGGMDAVGHRVVHGGDRFREPTVIDDEVLAEIDALSSLAPLHNRPALAAMRAVGHELGRSVPSVATFDTAFHRTLPDRAGRYAIEPELADRHRIRRYGFHGLAHRFMTERYAALAGRPVEDVTLVTLQLGNGCSAAAIEGGRSVDTSMGFTPLEGLMMGTRSGDVDPSLVGFLAQREGVAVAEAESRLNRRSGLLGVSGRSGDMRDLLDAERAGDERAALAVEMYCYRVRKYVGAYLAALGGADAVVFGGGIGENAVAVRERVCAGMAWCGLVLDPLRNAAARGVEGAIHADGSSIEAHVVAVDEELMIARDTAAVVSGRPPEAAQA